MRSENTEPTHKRESAAGTNQNGRGMSARPTVTVLICVAAAVRAGARAARVGDVIIFAALPISLTVLFTPFQSCAAGAYVIATRAAGGIRRRKPKRVGIFGLSANPPTNLQGHAGVVAHFLGTTLDEVRAEPQQRAQCHAVGAGGGTTSASRTAFAQLRESGGGGWRTARGPVSLSLIALTCACDVALPPRCSAHQVWVLPVYKHIYASKHNLAPFDDRVRMCQLTFEGLDGGSGTCARGPSSHRGGPRQGRGEAALLRPDSRPPPAPGARRPREGG